MIPIMFTTLVISFVLEGLVVLQPPLSKQARSFLIGLTIMLIGFSATSIFIAKPSVASAMLFLVALARFVNPLRFAEARLHPHELQRRGTRSFVALTLVSSILLAYILLLDNQYAFSIKILVWTQLLVALFLGSSVLLARTIYRYRSDKVITEKLPTVSVCIPARNETADLPLCIESVLASTYPKLEIIVLDDCSHDKTPEIIKKYAHDGVRFVNGKEPREDWVAKNAAYDRLADEARGDILLFIGVDVRMQPNSITALVSQLDGDDMLSVLPQRASTSESAFFIQPIRYWWELGLWRFSLASPPVLSTCWLIRADALKRLGTFESVKKAVDPEAVFARALKRIKKYAFLVANDTVGIQSAKSPRDQYVTALRKRYSQVRRRPETALLVITAELSLLLMPWLLLFMTVINGFITLPYLTIVTVVLLSLANTEVYKLALRRFWPLGFISMPILIVTDVALMLRSLYAYEFGKVIWKERNICLPLLTVEKSLPKL